MAIEFQSTPGGGLEPVWAPDVDGEFRWRPTPQQQRLFEAMQSGRPFICTGMRSGRSEAVRAAVVAEAATPEDALECLEVLGSTGVVTMVDGRLAPPPSVPRLEIVFDEGP